MPSNTSKDYGSKNGKVSKGVVWRKNTRPTSPVSWGDIDATAIRGAVDSITRSRGAIMLACTSDGGAFAITVLHGDEKIKEYPHTAIECEELLREITEAFTDELLG